MNLELVLSVSEEVRSLRYLRNEIFRDGNPKFDLKQKSRAEGAGFLLEQPENAEKRRFRAEDADLMADSGRVTSAGRSAGRFRPAPGRLRPALAGHLRNDSESLPTH